MSCMAKLYRRYVCGSNTSARLAKAKYEKTLLQVFQVKIIFNFASMPMRKTLCIAQNISDENEVSHSVQKI